MMPKRSDVNSNGEGRTLDIVQRWFQAVITHPDGPAAGVESRAAGEFVTLSREELERMVTRSQRLSAIERINVYANAYYARLLEVLGETLPMLRRTLGEETFNGFAFEYLQRYPPSSYTLDHLADRFVEYLTTTRPDLDEHGRPPSEPNWCDFLIDLAKLEHAIGQVFDGEGVEGQPLRSAGEGDRIDPPEPRDSWVALSRRDFRVSRFNLTRAQYELLGALRRGTTVGEAIADAAGHFHGDDRALAAALQQWFKLWSANQLFDRVELT